MLFSVNKEVFILLLALLETPKISLDDFEKLQARYCTVGMCVGWLESF